MESGEGIGKQAVSYYQRNVVGLLWVECVPRTS